MIQATEKAVFQRANMVLVSIRQAEVTYFSNFFATFGLQSALIAGVICGILSNQHDDIKCDYAWQFIYYTGSALCITSATQVLMSTLFTSVYGEQLALRGALGSISTTIDGMIIEQHQILFNYGIMILAFCMQEAGLYMIMMDENWGYFCVAIVLVGMLFTYRSALRIYNRFYIENSKTRWDDEINNVADMLNDFSPTKAKSRNDSTDDGKGYLPPTERTIGLDRKKREIEQEAFDNVRFADYRQQRDDNSVDMAVSDMRASDMTHANALLSLDIRESEATKTSWFARLSDSLVGSLSFSSSRASVGRASEASRPSTALVNILTLADNNLASSSGGAIVEGQLSLKMPSILSSDPWTRRYFILIKGQVFYYKDIVEYSKAPTKPINRRPIDLEGYSVIADSVDAPYLITLKPASEDDHRREWEFRCDTLSEFNFWLYSFTKAIKEQQV